jgi:glycerol kinase
MNLLCRLQADQLGVVVRRPAIQETTGLGAAFLAGIAKGVWSSTEELQKTWRLDKEFSPSTPDPALYEGWKRAVERARGWEKA